MNKLDTFYIGVVTGLGLGFLISFLLVYCVEGAV